jgi:non-specific serine/threonine protein kinase
MQARILIAIVAGLTVLANLALEVAWAAALAGGVAVFLVGEGAGQILRRRAPVAIAAPASAAPPTGSDPLSRRELEVAVLIARGFTSKEVGTKLFIERGTVDTHVQHIYNKLNIDSRPQLAVWLMERGLLPPADAPEANTNEYKSRPRNH